MVQKADKLRLKKLLMDAISLLCKNGLPVESSFRIEATIGITLSEDDVVLVSFREVVQPDGVMVPQVSSDEEEEDNNEGFGVFSDDDLNCNANFRKEAELDLGSSLPVKINGGEEETFRQNSVWNESGPIVGDSYPKISRNRKISSKDGPSNRFRDNSSQPMERSQMSCSLNDVPIQIKDEVLDDEECSFVKMEDGTDDCVGTFESLGQDDSWVYQVYNEANIYGMGGNEMQQFSHGFNCTSDDVHTGLNGTASWNNSSRDAAKSMQTRQSNYTGGVCDVARSGVQQKRANVSHGQDHNVARTLQSLCKTLADQACASVPGESVFCHICGARLSSHATLVKHIKGTHLAMSTCQCDICGQSFKWSMQLCRHRKRYHSNVLAE